MADKTKLRRLMEERVSSLDPLKAAFLLSEFGDYETNTRRIKALDREIKAESDPDMRKKIASERHQLVTEKASIFSHIMRHLGDQPQEKSALDSFLSGDDT